MDNFYTAGYHFAVIL